MIMPEGHYRDTQVRRSRNPRERWILRLGGLLSALVIAVTVYSLTSSQPRNGNGCLSFNYTMVMGGEQYYKCGATARRICARPPHLGGLANNFAVKLHEACIGAKFPYATAS